MSLLPWGPLIGYFVEHERKWFAVGEYRKLTPLDEVMELLHSTSLKAPYQMWNISSRLGGVYERKPIWASKPHVDAAVLMLVSAVTDTGARPVAAANASLLR